MAFELAYVFGYLISNLISRAVLAKEDSGSFWVLSLVLQASQNTMFTHH